MSDIRSRFVGMLNYVEQVIRLDERVVMRLSDYKLPDGTALNLNQEELNGLPGVAHDIRGDDGPVWLTVDRLVRSHAPKPIGEAADWITNSNNPDKLPVVAEHRIAMLSAFEKDQYVSSGRAKPENVHASISPNPAPNPEPRFDVQVYLEDDLQAKRLVESFITISWEKWASQERPKRKTIQLYQKLYKLFQLVENAGAESPVEIVWGIGNAKWKHGERLIDRPLLERRLDIECDDAKNGQIRLRPTPSNAFFDLKPYEEVGCANLTALADLIRKDLDRSSNDEGVTPFASETFENILSAAATRLDPEGSYTADLTPEVTNERYENGKLVISDKWVVFARPRSQHFVLQDIERLREKAKNADNPLGKLSEKLVTEPSSEATNTAWAPLGDRLGGVVPDVSEPEMASDQDIFFPKPFNDDQIEIVRRLQKSDGLVVQGPPGTGKTHTIANLICHSLATGQRVLVVSRGEQALSVLRNQLPEEIRSLAIAVLSSEREGLRQIEAAVREIQSVVEETSPQRRKSNIQRLESEILAIRNRLSEVDHELEKIASDHFQKIGPKNETPSELAQRISSQRGKFTWFADRPAEFSVDTGLTDNTVLMASECRKRVGALLDHISAKCCSKNDVLGVNELVRIHETLIRADEILVSLQSGPGRTIRFEAFDADQFEEVARALETVADTDGLAKEHLWLQQFRHALLLNVSDSWLDVLRQKVEDWNSLKARQLEFTRHAFEIPRELVHDEEGREAIDRAAKGERLWPLLKLGARESKKLVDEIRIDDDAVPVEAVSLWRVIKKRLEFLDDVEHFGRSWQSTLTDLGQDPARHTQLLNVTEKLFRNLGSAIPTLDQLRKILLECPSLSVLEQNSELCKRIASQLRDYVTLRAMSTATEALDRARSKLQSNENPTHALGLSILNGVGKAATDLGILGSEWKSFSDRLGTIASLQPHFDAIARFSAAVSERGAPKWAKDICTIAATEHDDGVIRPSEWRDAWDCAAALSRLEKLNERLRFTKLADERNEKEARSRKLFAELVRERTFYQLEQRLSPQVKTALVEFVRALSRIGRGTGKGAGVQRKAARDALVKCFSAIPCWIMPTWRVAEQLPPELGSVDLVILDEASQSDVTELPALLRAKKILVVGDDRQVSPTRPFVTNAKIEQLKHHYLKGAPYAALFEPGESIYDLMRAVFPDNRLMLKEHFRCVESIIRFSMQFYPEKMLPLRIPSAQDRLDPPLIDIYIPHGRREGRRKLNPAEADVIVSEIRKITEQAGSPRSIGVISLIGMDQAEHIRSKLSESIGEEIMQRHSILCGDSATFQGNERDIVLLSMVADPANCSALTMSRYEQRFNVAASRARDRLYLVRSVKREHLSPSDLKYRLIEHFDNPMPAVSHNNKDLYSLCESKFEEEILRWLVERGYRATPQVGSLGYRIDMVVEGNKGQRLAIECDGDRFHGPLQWREDMRREQVLRRVGWKFWRCFASAFYFNKDAVFADLQDTMKRMGIEPIGATTDASDMEKFTEHRVVDGAHAADEAIATDSERPQFRQGDRLALVFAETGKQIAVELTNGVDDLENGKLDVQSSLGKAVIRMSSGDELECAYQGKVHRIYVEQFDKVA